MLKKCVIQTRVSTPDGTSTAPVFLEPFVHRALYDIPSVKRARQIMAENDEIEMVGVRVGARAYVINVVNNPNQHTHVFDLSPETETGAASVE